MAIPALDNSKGGRPNIVQTFALNGRILSSMPRESAAICAWRSNRHCHRAIAASSRGYWLNQLTLLLAAAVANGWDLFAIPGSPTGAISLTQFEPSAFSVAVGGDQLG